MNQPSTPDARQAALGDLEQEISLTRRMLERVPDEHLAWRPHAKSMSLGGLARHIANLVSWQKMLLEDEGFDLASAPGRQAEPESAAQVLREFDANRAGVERALARVDDAALAEPWTLRRGQHVVFSLPRFAALRTAGISHMIHHRAQLGVYLRLLGVPVPPTYGPTADEQ